MTRQNIKLYGLWAILALPAAFIIHAYITDQFGYGQSLALTGDIAVKLLIVAMAATPARLYFPRSFVAKLLIKYRRALGVAVFAYAALHLFIYLENKTDLSRIIADGLELELLTGWVAFLIFLPLAITSNTSSVRKLAKKWKPLHRWIYLAAVLTLLHWVLTAFNPVSAFIHTGILATLEIARILKQRRS